MEIITYEGAQYRACPESRFHLHNLENCFKWMAVPADQLPGTMTHDKVAKASIEHQCALIDYQVFDLPTH